MDFRIEICTDNAGSAIDAQNAGADRIELCDNLAEGGTTPGYGTIIKARELLDIKLHVIIRPRGGDFLYSELEFEIMKRDIGFCRRCGVDGIVTGILKADGSIDTKRTKKLVAAAYPMTVTFHRAFDMCSDPQKGLEDVIAAGAERLLTSGHRDKASDGLPLIRKLVVQSSGRIIIMPGSGINENNIEDVARSTGATEFHFTGRKSIDSGMTFRKEGIRMGGTPGFDEYSRKVADPEVIRRVIEILRKV